MRRQANGRLYSPSMSLKEYAELHDLDVEELKKLVACTGTLKAQFERYEVPFYHIIDLKHWARQNSLRITAACQIS